MNTVTWIIQILLGVFFLMPGGLKLFSPVAKLTERKQLKPGASPIPVRILGLIEIAGSFGIIFPWYLGILPVLTPLAATGFCLVMIGAYAVHYKHQDLKKVFPLLTLILIASLWVALNRFAEL